MPYFPHFNVLHLHVPKTGGTSLENTFKELMHQEFFDYTESKERFVRGDKSWQNVNLYGFARVEGEEFALQHMTFEQLQRFKYLQNKTIDKIIIIVRHPYSRIVSEYKWQLVFGYNKSFNEFVREVWQKKWYQSRIFHQHLLPQYEFLRGIRLDDPRLHVVYFEHMKDGMKHVFNDLSIEHQEFADAELRRDNETNEFIADQSITKKPWRKFFENDPELFQIICQMYAQDFEIFGYEKNIEDIE